MGDMLGEVVTSKIIDAPKSAIVDAPAGEQSAAAIVAAPRRDSRSLAERIGAKDGKLSLLVLAEAACLSRLFAGIQDPAQALMKMVMGRELGIAPASSLRAIYITEDGRIGLYAETMAAMLRRHPRYDYRVSENTREACTVAILDRETGEVLGETRWTLKDDAVGAGLVGGKANWKKYPRAMLYARALAEAVRVHAPDVFAAVPIVAAEDPVDEITPDSDAEGWPVNEVEDAPAVGVDQRVLTASAAQIAAPSGQDVSPAAKVLREMLAASDRLAVAPPAVATPAAEVPAVVTPAVEVSPSPAASQEPLSADGEVRARLGPANVHVTDSILAAAPDGQVEPESVARELHGIAVSRLGPGAMRLWSEVGVKPRPGTRLTGRQARAFVALLPA